MRRFVAAPIPVFVIVALIGVGAILILSSLDYLPLRQGSGLGGGAALSETQAIAPYKGLTADGPLHVTLRMGDPAISLKGPRVAMDQLVLAAEGEELVLLYAGSAELDEPLSVTLSGRGVSRIIADGGAQISIEGGLARDLSLRAGGAAEVMLGGTCGAFELEVRNAARVDAGALACERVTARLADAAWARVQASAALDAEAGGVAALVYGGKPADLQKTVTGQGRIETR